MTATEFLSHLYKKTWVFIIKEKEFQEYLNNNENIDYDPADFYSDNIPELISELKNDFRFQETYKEIVGDIDISIRQTVLDFMAWFSNVEDLSGSDIYNSMYRSGFSTKPLDDIVKIVKNTPAPKTINNSELNNKLDIVFTVIEKFTSATKSLTSRRSGKPIIEISDEYDVQDIIHTILKPFIPTIRNEEVVHGKDVNKFLKIDFLLPSEKMALEIKYIRNISHTKTISKELNDDIQTYIHHEDCNNIVFFIYDRDLLIINPDSLEKAYTNTQSINGKDVNIYLKIRPKN